MLQLNCDRWDRGAAATFAISDDTDRCLGHVFVNVATQGQGTVGHWLLPEARRKGLATRAVRLVSHWALHELGLARVGMVPIPAMPGHVTPEWLTAVLTNAGVLRRGRVTDARSERVGQEYG